MRHLSHSKLVFWRLINYYHDYCQLPNVYCILPTVYCLFSTVYCLLPTAYCLLSSVYSLVSTVIHHLHLTIPRELLEDLDTP